MKKKIGGELMLLSEDEIKVVMLGVLSNHKEGLSEKQILSAVNQASFYYTFGLMINMALKGKIGLFLDSKEKLCFKHRDKK